MMLFTSTIVIVRLRKRKRDDDTQEEEEEPGKEDSCGEKGEEWDEERSAIHSPDGEVRPSSSKDEYEKEEGGDV